MAGTGFVKDIQYYKFCAYGFLKNLRFFEAFFMLYLLQNKLTFFQIGVVYATQEIARNLFEIPGGIFSDVIGRRRVLMLSYALYIVSFLWYFGATSFGWMLPAVIFFGLGDAFRTGTHKAMIFDYLRRYGWEDQKVHYYGHTRSWSQMGSAVSAALAAWLIFLRPDYRLVFVYTLVPYVVGIAIMATYPAWLEGARHRKGVDEMRQVFATVTKEFLQSFTRRPLLRGIVSLSFYSGYYKAMKDYMQPVVQTVALTFPVMLSYTSAEREPVLVGVVFTFLYFITFFMARWSGRVAEWFKPLGRALQISLIAGLAAGALAGVLYMAHAYIAAVVVFMLIYLIENIRKPIGIAYVSETMERDIMASALSAESQAESLFAVLVALTMGFMADQFGLGRGILFTSLLFIGLHQIIGVVIRKIGTSK